MAVQRFEVLLLDLMMPDMDGFEVMENLQQKELLIPTIILSALTKKESVLRAKEFGITTYLSKPLKPENVLEKVVDLMMNHMVE